MTGFISLQTGVRSAKANTTTESERLAVDSEPKELTQEIDSRVVTRICQESGKEFQIEQTRFGTLWFPELKYCDEVLERFAKEEQERNKKLKAMQREEARRLWIEENVPYYFKGKLDRNKDLDWKAVDDALQWRYNHTGVNESLVLKGATRRGKTRTAYEIAKRNALLFPHIETAKRIARDLGASLYESAKVHEKKIKHLCSVKLLCIDDLGKESTTHRTQTDLFEVINRRLENNRPTIITTNFDGKSLASRFPDIELAKPLVERIRESRVVEFS